MAQRAACWGPTKRQGVEDVEEYLITVYYDVYAPLSTEAVFPFVVRCDEPSVQVTLGLMFYGDSPAYRRYYFWFFGYVAKLPWEREIDT